MKISRLISFALLICFMIYINAYSATQPKLALPIVRYGNYEAVYDINSSRAITTTNIYTGESLPAELNIVYQIDATTLVVEKSNKYYLMKNNSIKNMDLLLNLGDLKTKIVFTDDTAYYIGYLNNAYTINCVQYATPQQVNTIPLPKDIYTINALDVSNGVLLVTASKSKTSSPYKIIVNSKSNKVEELKPNDKTNIQFLNQDGVFYSAVGKSATVSNYYFASDITGTSEKLIASTANGKLTANKFFSSSKILIYTAKTNEDTKIFSYNLPKSLNTELVSENCQYIAILGNTLYYSYTEKNSDKLSLCRINLDKTNRETLATGLEGDFSVSGRRIIIQSPTAPPKAVYYLPVDYNDDIKFRMSNTVILKTGSPDAIVFNNIKSIDASNLTSMPIIKDGKTFLPIRFLAESFGAKVVWEKSTSGVTITSLYKDIKMNMNSNKIMVDGKPVTMDSPVQNINGVLYAPLRDLSDAMEKKIFWSNGLIVIGANDRILNPDTEVQMINKIREQFWGFY